MQDRDKTVCDGGEYFLYCADTAYERISGEGIWDAIPEDVGKDSDMSGKPFDENNICQVYPEFCDRFGYSTKK